MSPLSVEAIANAILYEGYILYPYRPALKNHQRWTFGGLYPRTYSEAHGGTDSWSMQTECLVSGTPQTRIDVTARLLHLMARTAGEILHPLLCWPDEQQPEPEFRAVETLHVGQRQFPSWQEAVDRKVVLEACHLDGLLLEPKRQRFRFSGSRAIEPIRSDHGEIAGVLVREQQTIEGLVEVGAKLVGNQTYRVTVKVLNTTSLENAGQRSRDEALMHSLVSTHALLGVRQGEFISLMDPPELYREAAEQCSNVGVWPVLVGEQGQNDAILASPIILYDYPQVAPKSPGDMFDCTEVDEILILRILTLTDDEKRAMSAVDPRARSLLERTEIMAREQRLDLHGMVRSLQPIPKDDEPGRTP